MSEMCATCLFKEKTTFLSMDLLQVLSKLLEPCTMYESTKHLLNSNTKVCYSCYNKLLDMLKFRDTAIVCMDFLNNVNQNLPQPQPQAPDPLMMKLEAPCAEPNPTYLTLGENTYDSKNYNANVQSNAERADGGAPSAEYSAYKSKAEDNNGAGNNRSGMKVEVSKIEVVKMSNAPVAPKVPIVKAVPPPELVGNPHIGEHDYSDATYNTTEEPEDTADIDFLHAPNRQWYIKTLSNDEILTRMSEKRRHRDFLAAPYKCTKCVIVFRDAEQKATHHEQCHAKSIGKFSCYVCSRRFSTVSSLARHEALHCARVYICAECNFDTYNRKVIERHVCLRRGRLIMDSKRRGPPKLVKELALKCDNCPRTFNSHNKLQTHMRKSHKEPICQHCGRVFQKPFALKTHIKQKHSDVADLGVINKHHCAQCDQYFSSAASLRQHVTKSVKHLKSTVGQTLSVEVSAGWNEEATE